MTAAVAPLAARSRRAARPGWFVPAYYVASIALLYLPIAILFLFSINANTSLSFPLAGFTLQWYERLFDTPAALHAARTSFLVALASSVVATVLGTMIALLVLGFRFPTQRLLLTLAVLPLIVPFIVLGVAMLVLFRALHIPLSPLTVTIAHTVVALPYAVLIVMSRLVGSDRNVEEAAMDLGATYPGTLRLVVLPMIAPAMVSAWLTAFTVSFDEFALALFLAGPEPTFPVYLFGQLRYANTLPVMVALAVLLMGATIAVILVAERVRRLE
jgi:spermidine/putrescine transport system permease protein